MHALHWNARIPATDACSLSSADRGTFSAGRDPGLAHCPLRSKQGTNGRDECGCRQSTDGHRDSGNALQWHGRYADGSHVCISAFGIRYFHHIPHEIPGMLGHPMAGTILGVRILKLGVAYAHLRIKPLSEEGAVERLRFRSTEFKRALVDALIGIKPQGGTMMPCRLTIARLATGMFVDQEVRNRQGMLLAGKGQEITSALLIKIDNWAQAGLIVSELTVFAPL